MTAPYRPTEPQAPADDPVIIKKYANRRLYDTETSSYITLEDLARLIKAGRNVEVVDAKTGTDLTRATLAQIILDEDNRGAAMLPVDFLKQIISFYDNNLQSVLPHYLTMVMDVFQQNQQRIREETNRTLGGFSPFAQLQAMQDLQRQQLARLQEVLGLFNPFLRPQQPSNSNPDETAALKAEITRLKAELTALKK